MGYSSLNYLRQFDFHTLKMDRCFMSDVATNGKAAAVAKGVITLAHNLDLSVTAEGVEHNSQLAFLAAHSCDQAQGFLAGQPMCAEQFVDMLRLGDVRSAFDYPGFGPAGDLQRLSRHTRRAQRRVSAPEPTDRSEVIRFLILVKLSKMLVFLRYGDWGRILSPQPCPL